MQQVWAELRYLCPLQSLVVSLLLSPISTLLFFWTEDVLSHLNFLTHRSLRCPLWNLAPSSCSLYPLLSSLQRTQPSIKLLLDKIDRIKNFLCSACGYPTQNNSHLILHCPELRTLCTARFMKILFLSTASGPDPWELPGFGALWSFALLPSLARGRITTATLEQRKRKE